VNTQVIIHPLVSILKRAQEAVRAGRNLMDPSKAETIQTLHDVLCTGPADDAIANAERYVDRRVSEAQARFLPALEAVHNKLSQLRPHYTDTMGMSIDRALLKIEEAMAVAREAAR
jgi:CHAD domain-containing protein